jgi:CheY-like chemotaxis protein
MRLSDMTPAHVRRAVDLYMRYAWPPEAPARPRFDAAALSKATTLEELFAHFEVAPRDPNGCVRFALRLGNQRYPFMKFIVQEYLIAGEFFFSVDTHDNLDVRPSTPDYAAWQELKQFNRELKERIERVWLEAELPTQEDLRLLCEGLAPAEREEQKRARILLVDDEKSVAMGLGALLRARGYEVELFHTGEAVLARLARDPRPDLLLLDYELPEIDGEAVLESVHASPRLAGMPVLMATASSIDLGRLRRVSGLLRKPYPRQVLITMIRELLGRASTTEAAREPPGPAAPRD